VQRLFLAPPGQARAVQGHGRPTSFG